MSDETKYKLPHIPTQAIIKLDVSGAFLKKTQDLLIAMGEKVTQPEFAKILEKFKSQTAEPETLDEGLIFLLVALVGSLEKAAVDQKLFEVIEVTASEAEKIFGK